MNGPGKQRTPAGELFAEGGALGSVMSGIDWSVTPLGTTDAWPPRLVEALRIILFTEQPMAVFWGPEYTMLCNEAYTDIIGSKHPGALGRSGRDVFPENWELSAAPLFESVWESRKPSLVTDRAFVIQRRGFLEQSYFDVSFQPLLLEDGTVGGVLCVVTETTARVLSERRLRLLAGLGARTAGLRTPQSVARTVAEMLDIHRDDVPFTPSTWCPRPAGSGSPRPPPSRRRPPRRSGRCGWNGSRRRRAWRRGWRPSWATRHRPGCRARCSRCPARRRWPIRWSGRTRWRACW
ncbi:hypothetical protein [Streptomyces sp. NEAU-S77]|uniref:hypothetical protein n=1 Tax=Streptomyces sp. NEAU-S77 TaxID=3411033 RepID=UPI003BA2EE84